LQWVIWRIRSKRRSLWRYRRWDTSLPGPSWTLTCSDGYAITRRLNELGFAGVIEGTVYTILLRLEKKGLVQVTKRPSGMGPPRKFYALNDAGREELATFWAKWEYLSARIDKLKEGGK